MIATLLLPLALASDLDHHVAIFPEDRAPLTVERPPARDRYAGEVISAPVEDWTVPLPGPRLNAPTRSETSRPVVVGARILVGSASAPGLFILARTTGEQIGVIPSLAPLASAAVVDGDQVVFADTAGVVSAASVDGGVVWTRALGSAVLSPPLVAEGVVYVATVSDLAVALDRTTGALLWQYQRRPDATRSADLALYARPQPALVGKDVLFGMSDGSLVALDALRGDLAWEQAVGEGRFPDVVARPVALGTDVFASGYYEPFVAIDQRTHAVRWRAAHGSAAAPTIVAGAAGASWLVHPGTDGVLRAIDAATGDTRWEFDTLTGGALTTPVVAPIGLVVASSEGGLWIVDPATGAVKWTYDEPRSLEGISIEPTVAGRQILFVTDAGRIHSLVSPRPSRQGQSPRAPGVPRSPLP